MPEESPDLSASVPVPFAPVQVPAGELAQTPSPEPPAVPPPAAGEVVPATGDDITVALGFPYEGSQVQGRLIDWCARKIAAVEAEAADLGENLEIAKKNGWGQSALHRAHKLALRRAEYYRKIKAALEAGFVLVPNFPVEMFAVRTGREWPKNGGSESRYLAGSVESESPPAGEGEFQNPTAVTASYDSTWTDDEGKVHSRRAYYPIAFDNSIDFPFVLTKPAVLKATERAMAGKFFDEIGALPGKRKKEDPIVVGRIRDPRSAYAWRGVTFLVAWFVNTRDL